MRASRRHGDAVERDLPDIAVPLLMKLPRVSEGEDPAAIVSFEMEQMILPRLSGAHVPACFAAGDFSTQPRTCQNRRK
jgi:hypothetical protein